MTFEQEYPTPVQETKIVSNVAMSLGVDDADFCKRLVDWAHYPQDFLRWWY